MKKMIFMLATLVSLLGATHDAFAASFKEFAGKYRVLQITSAGTYQDAKDTLSTVVNISSSGKVSGNWIYFESLSDIFEPGLGHPVSVSGKLSSLKITKTRAKTIYKAKLAFTSSDGAKASGTISITKLGKVKIFSGQGSFTARGGKSTYVLSR